MAITLAPALPDAEALVIMALLTSPELTTDLGSRIYSVVPKEKVFPLARVFRYGGDPMFDGEPYWLDQPSLQVDTWADSRPTAQRIGENLRRACVMLTGSWPQGVVVSSKVSALVNTDDATFTPVKARYRFTLMLIDHP